MTTTAAPPPDRSELFEQTLDRLEASLAHALRMVIPAVAGIWSVQARASRTSASANLCMPSLRCCASRPVRGSRPRAAPCTIVPHGASIISSGTGDEGRALELIEEDELRVQISPRRSRAR